MRWLLVLFLFAAPLQAQEQSLKDFPSFTGVSRVTLVGYTLIFDLTKMDPLPVFRQWWVETEECTGLRGDFDSVRGWYKANWMVNPLKSEAYRGIYFTNLFEIVVQSNLSSERFENTVKHEILHHLISVPGHDETAFVQCLPLDPEHD